MLSIKLPPELIEALRQEAELRGADLTAVIEERLRQISPLHDKIDQLLKLCINMKINSSESKERSIESKE